MRSHRFFSGLAVLVSGFVLSSPVALHAGSSPQPLEIVGTSVALNPAARTATFDLVFNRKPDFYTLDSVGRPADSFQYYVNPDWSGNVHGLQLNVGQFRDVIRGDEIHTSGALLIRQATFPAKPEPHSGGWGPLIASEPFDLKGDSLTFTASYSDLHVQKGNISYEVFTTHFGSTVSEVTSWAVPVPPAAWTGIAMLSSMGLIAGARKLYHRRHAIDCKH